MCVVSLPGLLLGQERSCAIRQASTGTAAQELVGIDTVIVLYDPFTVLCSDGAELRANSGRAIRAIGEINLVGNVFFQDSTRSLTADQATYSRVTGRLYATGNVAFENRTDGSTLRGPELEYFRVMEGRELAEVNATQRPTLTLPPPEDSADTEPLELVGDRVVIIGEDDLSAYGRVIITRTDLDARAEEARYNSASEDLELRQNAVVVSEEYRLAGAVIQASLAEGELDHVVSRTGATLDSEEYRLAGDEIEATLTAGAIEHVVTRTNASMAGEDLEVQGEDLQLFFSSELLQRVVATNSGEDKKSSAVSRTFRLDADSLDAQFVDQQLEVVYAIGDARGATIDTTSTAQPDSASGAAPADSLELPGTAADSLPAESTELPGVLASDWIRGDTIIGYFEPVPEDSAAAVPRLEPAGSVSADDAEAPEVEIRRLVAIGSAQSLYRMTPTDPERATAGKDINFLVGDRIELELEVGELSVANVSGLQHGVFLEAAAPAPPGGAEQSGATDPPASDR